MKRAKKILKWFIISVLSLFLLTGLTGFVIIYFYEDEIKKVFVAELEKSLNCEIDVQDLEFSVFSKFPDASLEFKYITAYSPDGINHNEFGTVNSQVLFNSESLYLQFNVIDIFTGNYKIKKIHIDKGYANVCVDSKGKDNYHIFKNDSTAQSSDFDLALKNIKLTKMAINYVDNVKNIDFQSFADDFALSGNFSSESYLLKTKGELAIKNLVFDHINYLNNNKTTVNIDLDVNNSTYKIKKGTIKIADLVFDLNGFFLDNKTPEIDLNISGRNINIRTFLSLLPNQFKKQTKDFDSKGNFYFTAEIKGLISKSSIPQTIIKFGVDNGTVTRKGVDLTLTRLNLNGEYNNGNKAEKIPSSLRLNNFSTVIGNSEISGDFLMENMESPKVRLNMDLNSDLSEIYDFFEFKDVEEMQGIARGNIIFTGNINSFEEITRDDFIKSKTQGYIEMQGVSLQMKKYDYYLKNLSARFQFKNNDLKIDSLRFNLNDSDFFTRGYFKNIISYMFLDNQVIEVVGEISSEKLRIEDVMPVASLSEGNSVEDYIILPKDININVGLKLGSFSFGKFEASKMVGKFNYSNLRIDARNLSFNTLEGTLKTNVSIIQDKDYNFIVQTESKLENIDITKLFYSFSNFGQDFLVDSHLKGKVDGQIKLSGLWYNDFEVDEKEIIAEGKMNIKNGELIKFEPMEQLSQFISLSELSHIKFEELSNTIYIKEKTIKIPEMEIKSSAFGISLFGEHTFDNNIEYHLKILLSDFLFKKAKANKTENSEFGVIEDDGLGKTSLFLTIKGNVDDYKISYDTKREVEHIKTIIKEEGSKVKTLLNEELGLFKNDSSVIKAKEEKEKEEKKAPFTIVWDEDEE
ncbi:MAG: hypothetical protein JXR58_05250 [Bacteroidales bacterium]|nr:hypothetical protein [Bacteroidales bacterium]